MTPPLVPEIRLHLAEESLPIWQRTEEELGEINVPPPYWAFAWAGGQALARYLLDNPQMSAGRRVLDLGAGSGLTAIAACKAGAAAVLAADIDRVALAAIALNAEANARRDRRRPPTICWPRPPPAFGVVLVGDLFYERDAGRPRARLHRGGRAQAAPLVLIGDPQRSYFPRGRFEQLAEYRVPVTRELEDTEIKHTAVWRL